MDDKYKMFKLDSNKCQEAIIKQSEIKDNISVQNFLYHLFYLFLRKIFFFKVVLIRNFRQIKN